MQNKFTIKTTTIFSFAVIILAFIQILSYASSDWNSSMSGIRIILTQTASISSWMAILKHVSFWVIILFCSKYGIFYKRDIISLLILLSIVAYYSLDTIQQYGFMTSLYMTDIPIMYLFIIGIYAGSNEKIWEEVVFIIKILLPIYLIAFLYEFISTYLSYGWALYGGSSMTTFYSQLFWCATATLLVKLERNMENDSSLPVWMYALLIILIIGAVIIRSRGWVIQSILLLLTVLITNSRNQEKGIGRLKYLIGFLILLLIAVFIISEVFPLFAESMIDKGTSDTRSFQYQEIFEQTSLTQWLTGQGVDATYESSLYGNYSYIDNDFLYIAFHFSVVLAIIYFWPYLRTLFCCIHNRRKLSSVAVIFGAAILMWVFSVNGLSIYNRVHMDVKSILMPLIVGHIYGRCMENQNEDSICC